MTGQHEKFQQRLAASSKAVFAVAQFYQGKGHTVKIPPVLIAPTAAQAEEYLDDGDLLLLFEKRIEVKHRTFDFSSADDYPYPSVFISNVAAVDRARGQVSAYINVSRDLRCAAIIKYETAEHWFVNKSRASNTGNVEFQYACPLSFVHFEALP